MKFKDLVEMFYLEDTVKIGVSLMFANCLLDNKQTHNATLQAIFSENSFSNPCLKFDYCIWYIDLAMKVTTIS